MTTTTATRLEPPPSKPRPRARGKRRSWLRYLRRFGSLLKETAIQWDEDQAARQAASLALYTLLSIAPMLIMSIKVAGVALGDEAARGQLSQELGKLVGAQAGAAIEAMVNNANQPGEGVIGSLVGLAVLLFGASGVFGELQTALNHVWEVKTRPGRGVVGFLKDRFFSFTMKR